MDQSRLESLPPQLPAPLALRRSLHAFAFPGNYKDDGAGDEGTLCGIALPSEAFSPSLLATTAEQRRTRSAANGAAMVIAIARASASQISGPGGLTLCAVETQLQVESTTALDIVTVETAPTPMTVGEALP